MVKLEKSNGELGFTSYHTFITDPTLSECGKFEVDPIKHYGLTQEQLMILEYPQCLNLIESQAIGWQPTKSIEKILADTLEV